MRNLELTKNEITVLEALKELGAATDEELVKKTGLNLDGVRRSIYFLSEKGLVDMDTKKEERSILTEEGERAKEHLPEEDLLQYDAKPMSDIPNDVKIFAGKLKSEGIATIDNGVFKITGNIDDYSLKKALVSGDFEKSKKELIKRGYIREERSTTITARITDKGKAYDVDSDSIEVLTREMLESGSWKGRTFRKFVVKEKDIEPAMSGLEHPLNKILLRIKEVFLAMGFREMSGNYVETSFWNFDALYQPQDHPSRELADTFYLPFNSREKIDEGLVERVKEAHESGWKYRWRFDEAIKAVLRTHTTALSARTLSKNKSGKFFAIGRVFRNEAVDYKHLAEFNQVEGIIAHKDASFVNLVGTIKEFYKRIGFKDVRVRPSYFPYTEPSLEIEVWFEPKQEWVELGGAGIFRKEVVEPLGADYPVLAWGLSLERPIMILLGLEDIRDIYTNKNSFLSKSGGI
ncbi:MAG: phenylalanine--tRNA ligase subunit alpha [Methanobacteriota archaeon]|nr:MAG: phenylalanine--tRNA ligase subunit alpha [Euryarchaeota archaeon]